MLDRDQDGVVSIEDFKAVMGEYLATRPKQPSYQTSFPWESHTYAGVAGGTSDADHEYVKGRPAVDSKLLT